ncbi:hypothetical protein CKAH01_13741 [Colletotrichum kahawae]|uniref:Uncharacterized protein n=1 Tax=Colletotrichum kahawae TaxID=34407 RepID=A0AAE0DB77_COLKA|nr:hypothetical protein CKAH01_13741 [Colletotrichum kahawae]
MRSAHCSDTDWQWTPGGQICSCPRAAVEWCLPRLPLRSALGPNEAATENGPSHAARLKADTRSSPKPAPSPSS